MTWWFLIFSIVPLAFVTGYSLVQFESAINEELTKLLRSNSREVEVVISDLEKSLQSGSRIHAQEPTFVYDVNTTAFPSVRRVLTNVMHTQYSAQRISLFDRDGRLVIALMKTSDEQITSLSNLESGDVYLADSIIDRLKGGQSQISYRDARAKFGLELVVYTKVATNAGHTAGYLEETINVDQPVLTSLKKRFGLELVLFNSDMHPIASTQPDFSLIPFGFYRDSLGKQDQAYFDVIENDQPYGMMVTRIKSGEGDVIVGLAASKRDIKNLTLGINRALFTMVGFIILLLAITLFATSNMVLKPLQHLVEAAKRIELGEFGLQIPIESQTEIGLLSESFNTMSARIAEAQNELQMKLVELEKAYKELQETQAQLVQTAKMVSLGQLVAGVAHELNNPIGFIYSNMEHLREYGKQLLRLIQVAEKEPEHLAQAKKDADFDYLIEDMPRLIQSCEDGSRRVKDIVIGLRNFSRLDEFQLKEVDLEEGLSTTLNLLSGELKNRIEVHLEFSHIPPVKCYANQINQVFMNLLSNSAQAIDGKGDIWIKTQRLGSTQVKIVIRDSGKGISSDAMDKIFDPFFTTKPVGQGTGLGLSISYGIIKKHGGEINVSSNEGRGAQFEITLPLSSAEAG